MKMNLTVLALIVICLGSCTTNRYMYSPSVQNVPVLVNKGDSKLSVNYSTDFSGSPFNIATYNENNNKNDGIDLQGAIALTQHFALQANYFRRSERDDSYIFKPDSSGIHYKRNLAEIGIGYFMSMHREDKILFQVFGGVGKGVFSFTDMGNDQNNIFFRKHHQADVMKVFIQPAFIFRIKENFSLSVSTRLSLIKFSNIKTDYSSNDLQNYRLNYLDYGTHAFWEPAFTNSFGFHKLRGVKFQYQFLASLQVSNRYINYRSFNFSLGLLLDIPKMFQAIADRDNN